MQYQGKSYPQNYGVQRQQYQPRNNGQWAVQGAYQPKKRTGCTKGLCADKKKKGKTKQYFRGWRASKTHGILTYFCCEYKSTKECVSERGRVSYNWMCTVQPKNGQSWIESCFYYPDKEIVVVNNINIVLNPKTNYCGKNYRTK